MAATNSAYGGIRGLDNGTLSGGDGTGTAQFALDSHRLALVKQARDLTGNLLPEGADVDSDSEIYFILIVENPTAAPAPDIQLHDPLAIDQFQYISNSLEMTVLPVGSTDLWNSPWSPVTDAVGSESPDDVASVVIEEEVSRITFGAMAGQENASFDLERGQRVALRFRVRVE